MQNKKIAIIGCGNLGTSILNGLLEKKVLAPNNIHVTKRNISTLKEFEATGIHISDNNELAVKNSEILIIALKPYNVVKELEKLKDCIHENHIIVSLATGITIHEIANVVGDIEIFRAMPNTAADVSESLTCLCSNSTDKNTKDTINYIFDTIGKTIHIDEALMESATVLGACGIAYVLRFIRGMIQGGIEIGFDAKTAGEIVNQTVKGAAELLIRRKEHPEYEIDKVTTPKGCTIAGLNEMEHNGFSSALIKGITTSYKKIEK